MAYGTRVRAGAPPTVDLAPEAEIIFLNPFPLGIPYLAPILARLNGHVITTADLCAQPPPMAETWSFNDSLAALDPNQYAGLDAKLERMVRAGIWPTYCEFTVPLGGDNPTIVQVGHPFTGGYAGDGTFHPIGEALRRIGAVHIPIPSLLIVTYTCLVASSDGTVPAIWVPGRDTGDVLFRLVQAENVVGPVAWYTVPTGEQLPQMTPGVVGDAVWWPDDRDWWYVLPTDGDFRFDITVWQVGEPWPPNPIPWTWAPAVAEPQPYQFSEEAAANLTSMAALWVPPVQGPGLDIWTAEKVDLVTTALDPYSSIQQTANQAYNRDRALQALIKPLGLMMGGPKGEYIADRAVYQSGDVISVSGCSAGIVDWPTAEGDDISFGEPARYYRAGRVTWGGGGTWLGDPQWWMPPHDLVVSPQWVGGWGADVKRLVVTLPMGGEVGFRPVYAPS